MVVMTAEAVSGTTARMAAMVVKVTVTDQTAAAGPTSGMTDLVVVSKTSDTAKSAAAIFAETEVEDENHFDRLRW